jgi:hypothetical protein
VLGKDLSNPVPEWAEHGAPGGLVPCGVAVGVDAPNPDPGEEYPHANTQLFNILDDATRWKDATESVAPRCPHLRLRGVPSEITMRDIAPNVLTDDRRRSQLGCGSGERK